MAEFRGKVRAIFSNVKHDSRPSFFERQNGKVMAMEKISELSVITSEAQKRIKKEIVKFEDQPNPAPFPSAIVIFRKEEK